VFILKDKDDERTASLGAFLTVLLILGSLLAAAGWEFCCPRRRREFPALKKETRQPRILVSQSAPPLGFS
jgi:hypothetical protein